MFKKHPYKRTTKISSEKKRDNQNKFVKKKSFVHLNSHTRSTNGTFESVNRNRWKGLTTR